MPNSTLTIAITANSAWNILNFRWGLIEGLRADGYRIIVIVPPGREVEEIQRRGISYVTVKNLNRKGRKPIRDLLLIYELFSIYRKQQVDIVLHYTIKPVIYGSLAAHWAGKYTINTITGLGSSFVSGGWISVLVKRMYAIALSRSDITLFQNPDDYAVFVDKGVLPPERAGRVPGSGVKISYFQREPLGKAIPLRFLFVGRLLIDKGIREFVAAARFVKTKFPAASFQVVGGIDTENPTAVAAEEVAAWQAEGIIDYQGETEDVRPFITAATYVVLPSYREGLPRVMLEAAATGRPLIATDVPGCREIVIPGKNGWLVELKSVVGLAEAMQEALQTPPAQLEAMAEAGRLLVEQKFAEQLVIEKYRELIRGFKD